MKVVLRLGLALAGAAALFLASEGVLSLAFGRSWRALWSRAEPEAPAVELEREQAVAARATVGPYRVPEDPLVSYTLKLESELSFVEGQVTMPVRTDDLGLRLRPGAAAPESALRVVVLGDSVAFGIGLADEEVLAARLERELSALLPGRAVACATVALPSWNGRNAWRFLLDHLERFRPAIVVYLPVDNDLEDGFGVNEAGQRRAGPDPFTPQPLLSVHAKWSGVQRRWEDLKAAGEPPPRLGLEVLPAGLSETSRWRLADLARTIARGRERLARTGARVALAFYEPSDFQRELLAELARQDVAVPHVPLLAEVRSEDTLRIDPHPSAATTAAYARWIAQSLRELGWLPPEAGAVPAVEGALAGRRAPLVAPAAAAAARRALRAELEQELARVGSPVTLQGILQAYGGFNLDGSIATAFAAVLPRGKRLRVALEPLASRPDLYPLEVRVVVDGHALGNVVVPATGTGEGVFELGPAQAASAFEVRLEPLDWVVVTLRGRSLVAAAKLLALESLP